MAKAKKTTTKKRKGKKKGNIVTVDFTDVKSFKAIPEGQYQVKVTEAEIGEAKNGSGNQVISWTFEVSEGKHTESTLWHTTSLAEKALFNLREVLEALGLDVEGEVSVDCDEVIGMECAVNVLHEDYEGKTKAKIADFISLDDMDDSEEDDSDEDDKEEDEDSDEEEAVDVSKFDEDELQELIDDEGLDVDLDDYKSIKKKRAAVEEAMSSEDEEETDDEDTETYSSDQINKMKPAELQELSDDLDLGLEEVDEMKPKTARRTLIKALKKEGLLED